MQLLQHWTATSSSSSANMAVGNCDGEPAPPDCNYDRYAAGSEREHTIEQCFPTCGPRTPGGPRVSQRASAG
jgi:hypothetical protein